MASSSPPTAGSTGTTPASCSHLHWDHIQGLPFSPMAAGGAIDVYGPEQRGLLDVVLAT
jgi:hypothetical protein